MKSVRQLQIYKLNAIMKYDLSEIMKLAHTFIKRYGVTMSEALRSAWRNAKLRIAMTKGIVKFYCQKIDGTIREAYGTLEPGRIPPVTGNDTRRRNDSVQTYYDTEREEWRCYKKINLISIAA